jgi:D-lactate dehydrogenase
LKELGVNFLPLKDVFRQADILSFALPLNGHTKHMINKESIALMKDGVMIINTSRGALINTDAIDGLSVESVT